MPDEDVAVDGPKVTVGFERTISVAQYEPAKASIYITGTIDDFSRVPSEELVALAKDVFFAAKQAVYEQLGITFEVTQELVVQERLGDAGIQAVEVTSRDEAVAVAAASNTTQAGNPPEPQDTDGLWRELAEHPERYFDNRESKKGRQPDFKRLWTGAGLWLVSKNKPVPEDVVIPDRGFKNS